MIPPEKPATEQQLANIAQLGRKVGLGIRPASITSHHQAERVIESLSLLRLRTLHYNR